jgi:hypothetical protein
MLRISLRRFAQHDRGCSKTKIADDFFNRALTAGSAILYSTPPDSSRLKIPEIILKKEYQHAFN